MSDAENVVRLRAVPDTGDAGVANVLGMLDEARARCEEIGCRKAVVILLDDLGEVYNTVSIQTGLTLPDVIALLHVCAQDAHLTMRGGA